MILYFERHYAGVVCDHAAKFFPFVGQCFAEEVQNGIRKFVECVVVMIVGDPFVHNTPKTLNLVQMRGI